jgi:glycyl-tRNA synthetase
MERPNCASSQARSSTSENRCSSSREKTQRKSRRSISDALKAFMTWYDETGSIGKRYARFDEIGTPWCVTIDFDNTLEKNMVTIRHRDTMEQEVVAIEELVEYFQKALNQ